MAEQFISEAITPLTSGTDPSRMAAGEPGLPPAFRWRGEMLTVAVLRRSWRESGRCSHGSPEMYALKHWFEIETTAGAVLKVYFERQPRRGSGKRVRWWLYSIDEGGGR